jgi:hypothetical protein
MRIEPHIRRSVSLIIAGFVTAVEIPAAVGMEPWAMSPDYFENLEIAVRKAGQAILDNTLLKLKTTTLILL